MHILTAYLCSRIAIVPQLHGKMFDLSLTRPMAKVRTKKKLAPDMVPPVRPAECHSLDISNAVGSFVPAKHKVEDIPSIPVYNRRSGRIGSRIRSRRRVVSMPVFSQLPMGTDTQIISPDGPTDIAEAGESSNRNSWPRTSKALPRSRKLSSREPDQEKPVIDGYDLGCPVGAKSVAPRFPHQVAKSTPLASRQLPKFGTLSLSPKAYSVPRTALLTPESTSKYPLARVVSTPQFSLASCNTPMYGQWPGLTSPSTQIPQLKKATTNDSSQALMEQNTIGLLKVRSGVPKGESYLSAMSSTSSTHLPVAAGTYMPASRPVTARALEPNMIPPLESYTNPKVDPSLIATLGPTSAPVLLSDRTVPSFGPPHFSQPALEPTHQPYTQAASLGSSLDESVIKIFETYLTLGSQQSLLSVASSSDVSSTPSSVASGALELSRTMSASSIYSDDKDLPVIECDSLFDREPINEIPRVPVQPERRVVSEGFAFQNRFQYSLDVGADYKTSRFMIPESQSIQKSGNMFSPLNRKFSPAYTAYRNKCLPPSPKLEKIMAAQRQKMEKSPPMGPLMGAPLENTQHGTRIKQAQRVVSGPADRVKSISTEKHNIWPGHNRKQRPEHRATSGPVYQVKSFVR